MARHKSRTAGQANFAQIQGPSLQRSVLRRNNGLKTTMNAGLLVPVFLDEVLPGDTVTLKPTFFGRIATLLHPIMDNMHLDWFFFAVPNRILWDNWQKFMGEQENPGDSTDYEIPICNSGAGYVDSTLQDYLGLPIGSMDYEHSALPLRAYNKIYNEWFRPEDIIDSVVENSGDGPDDPFDFRVKRRAKRHDYFTAALPWPQKGDPVEIGFADSAPVVSTGDGVPIFNVGGSMVAHESLVGADRDVQWSETVPSSTTATWGDPKLEADLSSVSATTINELRQAFQFQRMLERDARGGTRYREILMSHFGVSTPDARLQRPEFLGAGSQPLFVREVPNTNNIAPDPQAHLAAYGTITAHGQGFRKSFVEHSIVMGLVCLRGDLNYQRGLERMWSRKTRFDFYWPSFANLGEQAILNKEVFTQGAPQDDQVFGYQERYAEYRYKPSKITGKMNSHAGLSLDAWHVAQKFENLPVLNSEFIEENPAMERIVAITDEPHLILDAWFDYECVRPMPTYGTPGMIDHF